MHICIYVFVKNWSPEAIDQHNTSEPMIFLKSRSTVVIKQQFQHTVT
jgi:hypothetical protein